jgi:EmrB/QacA subfamily drug resistance transporter
MPPLNNLPHRAARRLPPQPSLRRSRRPQDHPTGRFGWTFAIAALALFMFALDRLIVTNALPIIRRDLHAGVGALEWTVNAFTLTFAVLLLTGAALGDRYGRRRVFTIGLALFTAGSAAAALSPSAITLIIARALQGAGGAILTPLSLTLLTAATPPARRGVVLGAWGAVAGIAAAAGPVVGGALSATLDWHWIFWLNVPIGVALIPLAHHKLAESHGPHQQLDLPGLALSGLGLLALVWGLVELGTPGWHNTRGIAAIGIAAPALAAFLAWERRAAAPMLPLAFFRTRAFATASATAALAYSGIFGTLFLLGQLLQTGLGASPLHAGIGLLAMTAAMVITAPIAGRLSDRVGPRPLITTALALAALAVAWIAANANPGVTYAQLAPALALFGIAAASLFAPIQTAQHGAVPPAHHGQAAGAATAIREFAGVLGVTTTASIFAAHGSAATSNQFLTGCRPALLVAALTITIAALPALALPRHRPSPPPTAEEPVRSPEPSTTPA